MELNAEQIKYCLELILKSGIGMNRDDVDVTDIKRTLSLITSQEQRIAELTEENDRLHASCTELTQNLHECKADTVQNYREKLHREFASLGAKDKFNKGFFLTKADQIAKEISDDKL